MTPVNSLAFKLNSRNRELAKLSGILPFNAKLFKNKNSNVGELAYDDGIEPVIVGVVYCVPKLTYRIGVARGKSGSVPFK